MSVPERSRGQWVDLALAAAVLVMGVIEVVSGQLGGPRWAGFAAVGCLGAAQLVRRSHLWVAVTVTFGSIVISYAVGVGQFNFLASVVAGLAVLATVGYVMELRPALFALGFGFVCVAVTNPRALPNYLWLVIVMGGAWGAGCALRSRRLLIEELRAATAELERTREDRAEQAVIQERLRIARDIHDIVAHSVTVMLVQAAAAERTAARSPADAAGALSSVQESGRQALAQLRQMLSVLRLAVHEESESELTAPQPGLAEVPPLVAQFRAAGLAVDFVPDGVLPGLDPSVGLTAYRVAQEALTNVLRHSCAQAATLHLGRDSRHLVVDVRDPGPARLDDPRLTGGHGLIGMRERVRACGGDLDAGPDAGGGFRVTARLPLDVTR